MNDKNKTLRPFQSDLFDLFPRRMDEVFSSLLAPGRTGPTGFDLKVDVSETPESYLVRAEVPGLDPKDIDVTLTGDTLTIRGEKRTEERRDDENVHVVERSYGGFQRSFSFPTPVATENIDAEAKNGVLEITLKKTREAQSRRIDVKTR